MATEITFAACGSSKYFVQFCNPRFNIIKSFCYQDKRNFLIVDINNLLHSRSVVYKLNLQTHIGKCSTCTDTYCICCIAYTIYLVL